MNDIETVGSLQTSLDNAIDEIENLKQQLKALQRIAADLNKDNIKLKQEIARLKSDNKQKVYPWKTE